MTSWKCLHRLRILSDGIFLLKVVAVVKVDEIFASNSCRHDVYVVKTLFERVFDFVAVLIVYVLLLLFYVLIFARYLLKYRNHIMFYVCVTQFSGSFVFGMTDIHSSAACCYFLFFSLFHSLVCCCCGRKLIQKREQKQKFINRPVFLFFVLAISKVFRYISWGDIFFCC